MGGLKFQDKEFQDKEFQDKEFQDKAYFIHYFTREIFLFLDEVSDE